jgi:hypothetical protein
MVRLQATSTRGVPARLRRVAGCATATGSAGHAGETANLKLIFHLDHSAGLITFTSIQNLGLMFRIEIENAPDQYGDGRQQQQSFLIFPEMDGTYCPSLRRLVRAQRCSSRMRFVTIHRILLESRSASVRPR